MAISVRLLLKGTLWTVGSFGLGQIVRFATNIILARLVAPDLFGIMLIVNSVTLGIELMSDVGIGQNIIYHEHGNAPEYYNTAWTLQALRSIALWFVASVLALPFAHFYHSPILAFVIPVAALSSIISGFSSVSLSLLRKGLQVPRLMSFELIVALIGSLALIIFAYVSPTIWALVLGSLFGNTVGAIGSYFLLREVRQRFYLSKTYVREILQFGKWIFASSLVYFLATNFDKLYLGKVVPLAILGVYGIARSMSDALGLVVWRLGNYVLFPLIASHSNMPRSTLRLELAPIRMKFLVVAGVGFSLLSAVADLPIRILYDQRYQAAAWMLPILVMGSWFAILAYINESTIMGLGKPIYTAISNTVKLVFLLLLLPLSAASFGILGGITVIVLSDMFRYFPLLIGQRRENVSFGVQDFLVTVLTFALVVVWEGVRWSLGFGTSFESLPMNF